MNQTSAEVCQLTWLTLFTDNSCWPGQSDNLCLFNTVTMITSCAYNTIQFGGVHLDNSDEI